MKVPCAVCKGKGMCGLPRCPIIARFDAQAALTPGREYSGEAPSVFIGSRGYPRVSGGPLLADRPDNPPEWLALDMGIEDIVAMRARTIRGTAPKGRDTEKIQEIALSSIPVAVEIGFEKPVLRELTFDGVVTPVGLTGTISSFSVTGSARVERVVDRVSSDRDLGAGDAAEILHDSGVDVYHITRLISAGLLGRRRRMVPTKWAITAVDDTVSRNLAGRIKKMPWISEIEVFFSEIFGNRMAFLLFPGEWQFEMIEIWEKNSLWGGEGDCIVIDGEGSKKSGYSPISGAYYSARLAAAEYLHRIGRCARTVVVRSVSGDYWAPLGTWVVREASRKAMSQPPMHTQSIGEAVSVASGLIGDRTWASRSRLIPRIRTQKTLRDFFIQAD